MIDFDKTSAREMRYIIPTADDLSAAFMYLIEKGWKPNASPHPQHPALSWGWWIHPDHPVKNRPVGDGKNIWLAAWDTIRLYIVPENRIEDKT